MLLKCVQCEDRSGYIHTHKKKKNWWESTGDAVSFKRMRGGWGGDSDEKEEGEKEKTRGEDSDSSSLWVSLHGLCQEKQGPSKVGNLISAESCGRKRCSSGGRGADPQPWSTPKIFSPQNTSVSSSLKSLYVSPSVPFWPPGQDHSLSSGLCIFSDFPGYSSVQGQKSFVWEVSHFTLALAYRVKGNENQVPHVTRRLCWLNLALLAKGHYLHMDHITSTVDYRTKG